MQTLELALQAVSRICTNLYVQKCAETERLKPQQYRARGEALDKAEKVWYHGGMKAKHPGKCQRCEQPIKVDDDITKNAFRLWFHTTCRPNESFPQRMAQHKVWFEKRDRQVTR